MDIDNTVYRFGEFELVPAEHLLTRAGERLHLQPKTFEVLLFLVVNNGHLITKDEMLSKVWPGLVVSDNALTRCILDVRKTLGEKAGRSGYIETVPKVGYRFNAQLEVAELEPVSNSVSTGFRPMTGSPEKSRWLQIVGISLLLLIAYWIGNNKLNAPVTEPGTKLAILPFDNKTGRNANDFLINGFLQGIRERVSIASNVQVVGSRSSVIFKDSEMKFSEIASQLEADWLLSGSFEEMRGDFLVTATLFDSVGSAAWTKVIDLVDGDVLGLQEKIVSHIGDTLGISVSALPQHLAISADINSINAHHLYLTGRGHMSRRSSMELAIAIENFEEALKLNPNHAGALSSLGVAFILSSDRLYPAAVAQDRALGLLNMALEIDPRSSPAFAGLALLHMSDPSLQEEALSFLDAALKIDPNNVDALVWSATLANSAGRHNDSYVLSRKALMLDPFHASLIGNLAFTLAKFGKTEEALTMLESASRNSKIQLALVYNRFMLEMTSGHFNEGLEIAQNEVLSKPSWGMISSYLAMAYEKLQMKEQALYWSDRHMLLPGNERVKIESRLKLLMALDEFEAVGELAESLFLHRSLDTDNLQESPYWLVASLGRALVFTGDYEQGSKYLMSIYPVGEPVRGLLGAFGTQADDVQYLAIALQMTGQPDIAQDYLDDISRSIEFRKQNGMKNYTEMMGIEASNLALSGQSKQALEILSQALDLNWLNLSALEHDPRWTSLRDTAEFQHIITRTRSLVAEQRKKAIDDGQQMNFASSWAATVENLEGS